MTPPPAQPNARPPARSARSRPLVAGLALLLAACSTTTPAGNPFAPVAVTPPASAVPPPPDAFTEPEPIKLSSEEMATGTVSIAAAAGVDLDKLMADAPAPPPAAAPPAAPPAVGVPPDTRWPVRLVSTLPQAQPPRAILGLPSGEELVVSPGSMLAEQGIVVVSVSAGKVELASVEPAGDHAKITTITLTSQY